MGNCEFNLPPGLLNTCGPSSSCNPSRSAELKANFDSSPGTAGLNRDSGADLIETLDFLWLEVTSKCNLECVHCYADSGPFSPVSQGMSYDDWLRILAEAFELGCRKVQFIGGEPTIYPHLCSLLRFAKALGYDFVEVFTNATRLPDATLDTFRRFNVHVAFSLYGSRSSVHDAITQREGSFAKTIEGIQRALAVGLSVRAAIIELDINAADVEATKTLLHNLGVESVDVDRVRGIGRGAKTCPPSGPNPFNELCGACWRGKLVVDSHGDVYPCVFSRFYRVGTAGQALASILRSESLLKFRSAVRQTTIPT
jgi:MoaA/NifB/PqqE/SkfB family radical SAM enzyme